MYTNAGELVHNKPLLAYQRKFLIDEVFETHWPGFNKDLHSVGSFDVWVIVDLSLIHI